MSCRLKSCVMRQSDHSEIEPVKSDTSYLTSWFNKTANDKFNLGPVHTMPDKFENATLLLRIRLPSTLIRLYPHKKIHENGTF